MPKAGNPLKIHGGDAYQAKQIVSLMAPHKFYVETHAGAASVLLEHDPTDCSETLNDCDHELTNFWRVLAAPQYFEAFRRGAEAVGFSEPEWVTAAKTLATSEEPVCRAIAFYIRCRQSRAGNFKNFATLTKGRLRRGMNEQVSAWLSSVDNLPEIHARLRRVLVLDRDGTKLIRETDTEDTQYYIDPPFHPDVRTGGGYKHEMTVEQHQELVDTLIGIKGKAIVSMYHHPMYDVLHEKHGWRLIETEQANQVAGGKTKRRMIDCLWLNYDPPQ